MPAAHPDRIMSFETATAFAQWLELNHATESELWVKIFKKGSGIVSVNWDDVVIESLCWGWIDGIKKSLNEQAYLQRITPRKARSVWSKRNRQHVERLIAEGKMMATGLVHVHAAQADGRWDKAYAVSEMQVPDDFIKALEEKPEAKQFFESLNKSSHQTISYDLSSAKKAQTRERRFVKYMDMMLKQQKPV
jgi:uncharacterized protein YdeI (YjbR/CyaY-like superfamily)